jgi:hypothetical protein
MFGPSGSFAGSFLGLEWRSQCTKPYFSSYRSSYDTAPADYETYVRCVQRKARADSQYAAEKVIEEANDEIEEVQRDARLAGYTFR